MVKTDITLWAWTKDTDGKPIARLSLVSTDFVFKTVSGATEIKHTIFTDNGNGSYTFDGWEKYVGGVWTALTAKETVYPYISTVLDDTAGPIEVGSDDLRYLRRDDTVINCNNKILDNVANATADDHALNKGQADDLYMGLLSNQWNALDKKITSVDDATDDDDAPNWRQVQGLVSGLVTYQESPNMVRCIPGGTQQTGKVYLTLLSAINYFTAPAETKQCAVYIPGTGVTSQFISLAHSSLKDYVHIIGAGHHINIILGSSGASVTKTMTFKNVTIWLSNLDILTARTYSNITFEDCIFYAFNDTTFSTGCKLRNCIVFHAATANPALDGNCELYNTAFNMPVASEGASVLQITPYVHNFAPAYSMPADPLTA